MVTKKILVVDDEPQVRALVTFTVNNNPRYQIFAACNGLEALEMAQREKPDLILLDVLMPGLSGLDVCRRIKANPDTRATTVIMLSAMAQETDKQRALDAGADGYFTKPFSPLALLNKISEILG